MPGGSRAVIVLWVLRGALLVFGVITMTVALVGSFDAEFVYVAVEPWWYLGIVGLVAVLVALGSPWTGRLPTD
jgi:hypothetical protein